MLLHLSKIKLILMNCNIPCSTNIQLCFACITPSPSPISTIWPLLTIIHNNDHVHDTTLSHVSDTYTLNNSNACPTDIPSQAITTDTPAYNTLLPAYDTTMPGHWANFIKLSTGSNKHRRSWFSKLKTTLQQLGFNHTISDTSLFTKFTNSYTLFVLIYVDHIIIIGSSPSEITNLINNLSSSFALKDLGPLYHFLEIQLTKIDIGDLHLSTRLQQKSFEPFTDPTLYTLLVGALQYVLITRPKLSYSINCVCHFMHDPRLHHWQAFKCILRYLKGTLQNRVFY